MRRTIAYLFLSLLLLGCGGNRTNSQDAVIKDKAKAVAQTAASDLSLKQDQIIALESAIYDLFASMDAQSEMAKDESEMSELKSKAHKTFQDRIAKDFSSETATEILAWYFNYSNAN